MDYNEYLEKMKNIQTLIINYIDENEEYDESNLFNIDERNDIENNQHLFIGLLNILSAISTNHHRGPGFFKKIEKIFNLFTKHLQTISKYKLYKIFQNSQLILYFLFKKKLLIPDDQIISNIITNQPQNVQSYFYPELKSFFDNEYLTTFIQPKSDYDCNSEMFDIKREIGQNDDQLSRMIQNDAISQFVEFVNKSGLRLSSKTIEPNSFYETNVFLQNKKPTLIEYAAFFGSIQIFKYLVINNVELKPSIWPFAIHSNNPDLIHMLEEKKIKPEGDSYQKCFIESIKCHHNNVANYINENYLHLNTEKDSICIQNCLKFYNFEFLTENMNQDFDTLFYSFHYDYFYIAQFLMKNNKYDLNKVKTKEVNQDTLINEAVINDDIDLVKLLLHSSQNINVNTFNNNIFVANSFGTLNQKEKITPLYNAIYNRNLAIIDLLLSQPQIDLNAESIILKNKFKPRKKESTSIWSSPQTNTFVSNSPFSLKNPKNTIKEEKTALFFAVEIGELPIVQKLLENKKININCKGKFYTNTGKNDVRTALCLAVEKNDKEMVSLLLSDPNINVNEISILNSYYQSLTDRNDFVTNENVSPLHIAIMQGYQDIIQILIKHPKIDLNLPKKVSNVAKTPLYLAVQKGNHDIIKILLSNSKLDPNKKSIIHKNINSSNPYWNQNIYDEKTPLHFAVEKQDQSLIQIFLNDQKVDVNEIATIHENVNNYKTALHIAIDVGNKSIMRLLLKNELIDCNIKLRSCNSSTNYKEKTLLCVAIDKKDLDILKIILEESSMEINEKTIIQTEDGKREEITPLLYAIRFGNDAIVQFLLSNNRIDVNSLSKFTTIFDNHQNSKNNFMNDAKESEKLTALQYMIKSKDLRNKIDILLNNPRIDVNSKSYIKRKEKGKGKMNNSVVNFKKKSIQEETALSYAIELMDQPTISKLLKQNKININCLLVTNKLKFDYDKNEQILTNIKQTALHQAVQKGIDIQDLVNHSKIDINAVYTYTQKTNNKSFQKNPWTVPNEQIKTVRLTALHMAVSNEKVEIFKTLLSNKKININSHWISECKQSTEEKDALHLAICKNKNTEIASILCHRDDFDYSFFASLNSKLNKIEEYKSHLFLAVENNKYDFVKLLLENPKVNVNEKSCFIQNEYNKIIRYKTALHIAVEKGHYNLISLLKQYNADIII